MNKSQDTRLRLEAALQRILDGQTQRIPETRKLSVRSVEEEANLGNGSGYYYPDFVEKVKSAKQLATVAGARKSSSTEIARLRKSKRTEERLKVKYRDQVESLKAQIALMAAEHHQLAHALRETHLKIEDLEKQLIQLKQKKVAVVKQK